jgi:hypothetical protein
VAPAGAEKGGAAGVARGMKHMLAVNPVYVSGLRIRLAPMLWGWPVSG